MKVLKIWIFFAFAILAAFGVVGCNLFNPTNSVHVESDDTQALTYEGYIHIRDYEYTKAAEYFSKAIKSDSSYSEAWFGLAKAVLNQYGLNVFEMLKYTKKVNGISGFFLMEDSVANRYYAGIDTVTKILDKFIDLEKAGKTDKHVTFENFSNSYSILQMANVAILARKTATDMVSLVTFDSTTKQMSINWEKLKDIGQNAAIEAANSLAASAKAIIENPDKTFPIVRNFVPEADSILDDDLKQSTQNVAQQIIDMSENLKETPERTSVFLSVGNGMDDDGDGCIDEEIWDGKDNDGDGEIDEDMRPNHVIVFNKNWTSRQIDSLKVPSESPYNTLDLNMDGIVKGADEWTFYIQDPVQREAAKDHRFVFATTLNFVPGPGGDKIYNKELVRNDTDITSIKYDLAWRKANVGGCWVNYSEADFLKWFEGRN